MDFLVTVPNATPAVPHGGMAGAIAACGYTFLWNLLDYSAGVVPVTTVDAVVDALGEGEMRGRMGRNGVSKGAYLHYDAGRMAGLPVGVQVVGRRLEEEGVLGGMEVVVDALKEMGVVYEGLDVE